MSQQRELRKQTGMMRAAMITGARILSDWVSNTGTVYWQMVEIHID